MFKHPYLSESAIAQYYRSSPETFSWGSEGARYDFDTVREFLHRSFPDGGDVLDFGCYRGGFLSRLPSSFAKKGIEPSKLAAEAAARDGIEIIGGDLTSLEKTDSHFHAITLFDVFEHLTNPVGTIDVLFSRLRLGEHCALSLALPTIGGSGLLAPATTMSACLNMCAFSRRSSPSTLQRDIKPAIRAQASEEPNRELVPRFGQLQLIL